jgi:hypothetical protein
LIMEKNPLGAFPEIIVGTSDKKVNRQISALRESGKIRRIAPRLYTPNLEDPPEEIVRRNIFEVLGKLYPGGLLSHRSAFEYQPTESGHIFLTHTYTRKTELPGVTIRFIEGPPPLEGDHPFSGGLMVSQQARAFLENMQSSRRPGPTSKTLTLPEIEEKLEQIIRIHGDDEINRLRESARLLAGKLEMEKEYARLDSMIGALLATKDSNVLTSPLAVARAFGSPYDPGRVQLFETLFRELQDREFKAQPEVNQSVRSFRNFAFFESYFSNYIEGTVFEIGEALAIIESGTPLPARHEDSHDILETYRLVSDQKEMSLVPGSAEELIRILQNRHRVLLGARRDKNPGLFKDRDNVAGQTVFVDKELVRGTLMKGFDLYHTLKHPFKRAAFIMFLVSEVHPFLDGNGRMARVMMNAELVAARQAKIIIPTVYRDDYLGALRKLTRRSETDPYIRMLLRAREFSTTVTGDQIPEMQLHLETCNAFLEPTEGKLFF